MSKRTHLVPALAIASSSAACWAGVRFQRMSPPVANPNFSPGLELSATAAWARAAGNTKARVARVAATAKSATRRRETDRTKVTVGCTEWLSVTQLPCLSHAAHSGTRSHRPKGTSTHHAVQVRSVTTAGGPLARSEALARLPQHLGQTPGGVRRVE